MLSQEIRSRFLSYFRNKGHAVIPSSSVVPLDDPTLLFINAGMNQFKDVFLGKSKRDYARATTSQKCIRVGGKHNDLDNVGHTSRHLTFFEMLGNFSFGDYFKEEAIDFSFEVTTQVFGFDPAHLWVSVFEEDDEALELWKRHLRPERIVKMGEKENFWAMGDTGPCGPCSELLYDRGDSYGTAPTPLQDASGERYLEFWNLVFMQYNRDGQGKMSSLPSQCIDTGAGLERVISLKMGVDNVFHTDVLHHLIRQIERVSKRPYDATNSSIAPAFHVIADHLRALAFAIGDGAQPSNVDRGYVLRKLLRRAVRYGRTLLGLDQPFLAQILPALIEAMGNDFRELPIAKERIAEILTLEEENFFRTLKRGGNILSSVVEHALKSPHRQISGEEAFKLKDTYGFPFEEILLIAKDSNLQVNIDSFQLLEEQAKERSRSARATHHQEAEESFYIDFLKKQGPSLFTGYAESSCQTTIVGIIQHGVSVDSLVEGQHALVLLKATPFYAEKGGQVGDIGRLFAPQGEFQVSSCASPYSGLVVHEGSLSRGFLRLGDEITATIDDPRRKSISAHHTATHLLHFALQQLLGEHIRQAGSLVERDRLRFDFNHHKSISPVELAQIEDLVNQKVRDNQSISTYELPFDEVQHRVDIKQFFGEKYGSHVRVVDIEYSKELCGGTHVRHTGELGYFRITKEGSIASGVRRIEACCGRGAEEFVKMEESLLMQSAALLKIPHGKLSEKVSQLIDENVSLRAELRILKRKQIKQLASDLSKKIYNHILALTVDVDPEDLPELAEEILTLSSSCVIALGVALPDRAHLFVRVSPDLVKKGLSALTLIKAASPSIKGGGGGKEGSAQAGGKEPKGIEEALKVICQQVLS